jgi:hypothetical protein
LQKLIDIHENVVKLAHPWELSKEEKNLVPDLNQLDPAKVSFDFATVTKDRTAIEVKSSISIKIQVINLSGVANSDLDLQNVALNLGTDLENKLGGKQTTVWNLPFKFKSKEHFVTNVETARLAKDSKNYSVTYNTLIFTDISVVDDISKIDKDAWVFALVDNVNDKINKDDIGVADVNGGKVAIGEAKYFERSKAYKEGRQLILHETLHLLGASDTYPPYTGYPGTQNENNVMYYNSPDNQRQLTPEQVVKEIMNFTMGGIGYLFTDGTYKQHENPNSTTPTQQQLKTFVKENGSAKKLDNQ